MRKGQSEHRFKLALVAPSIFLLLLIGVFPLVYLILVSFQNITMTDADTSFQGLLNYRLLFGDRRLWEALLHTLVFILVALPVELVLGLLMAQLFIERIPGRAVFVALLVLPVLVSPIVAGATWSLMFDNRFGPINQILGWFAGQDVALLWTIKPYLVYPAILMAEVWQWTPFMFLLLLAALSAVDKSQLEAASIDGASYWRIFRKIILPAIWPVMAVAILMAEVWQWTPFMFLLLLAALSAVDKSQLEAASIDGASYWRIFRKIILPAIWPVMAVAILIRALDLFRLFDVVWALTKGGPGTMTETISMFAYIKGFQQFETSYIAAVALLIIVLLSVVVLCTLKRVELAR